MQKDLKVCTYLFSRKDCSACIDLIELTDNQDTGSMELPNELKINVIETTELTPEGKAEVVNKYEVQYVPKIMRVLSGKVVYEMFGGFSEENIAEVLTEIFKEDK